MLPADTVLAVIRGELPLTFLSAAGIHAVITGRAYEEQVDAPIEIAPAVNDVVHGLWIYRNRPNELRQWALFMMGTEVVDFANLHTDPRGEELTNALWDASFSRSLSRWMLEHLEQMQPAPDQIQAGHEEDQ